LNLSIKAVPVDLAARLRARAARNHRSLQRELMAIIEVAAGLAEAPLVAVPGAGVERASSQGNQSIDEVLEWIRERVPESSGDAPRAVDIVRAARDMR